MLRCTFTHLEPPMNENRKHVSLTKLRWEHPARYFSPTGTRRLLTKLFNLTLEVQSPIVSGLNSERISRIIDPWLW